MNALAAVNTADLLVSGMKVCRERHHLLANNIANADTPNFNPAELDFQKTLQATLDGRERVSLRKTQPRHIGKNLGEVSAKKLAFLSKNDYNKVDLEDQMAKLAENTGQYNVFGSLLGKQFEQVKGLLSNIR